MTSSLLTFVKNNVIMPKRKIGIVAASRGLSSGKFALVSSYRASAKRRRVGPGYQRTTGFYGRFAGAGAEQKFFDEAKAQTTCATGGTVLDDSLNEVPQGTTESERIGRKIVVKSLQMHGEFALPGATAAANMTDRVRCIVYLDKQANGGAATVLNILQSADIDSFYNLENQGRFRILMDKMQDFNATSSFGATLQSAPMLKTWKLSRKLNFPIEMSGTAGAITEMRSNNIGVIGISESGLAQVQYQSRIRYGE